MWWWGILNKYQAAGFLLAAGGSWLAHLPIHWTFTILPLMYGWSICVRNEFQPLPQTPYERAQAVNSEKALSIFWAGLAVYCSGVAAGQVLRVTQNGVSPKLALLTGGLICIAAVVMTGVLAAYATMMKRRKS